jgi:hypothetical protein
MIVKNTLIYLRRAENVFLVYRGHELEAHDFSNASFQSYIENIKSYPGYVINLNGGVVN